MGEVGGIESGATDEGTAARQVEVDAPVRLEVGGHNINAHAGRRLIDSAIHSSARDAYPHARYGGTVYTASKLP